MKAPSFPLTLLFEDQDLVAVDKPSGLPTQPTVDKNRANLFSELQKQLGQTLYLHHRLDRDTSGIVLLGKSKRANLPLSQLFQAHHIQKTYFAITVATPPDRSWLCDNFIAPDKSQKFQKMQVVRSGGQRAITHFTVVENLKSGALVKCQPLTGRTHQIRIHLSSLGLPILGDELYGHKKPQDPRLMLHAAQLQLTHPFSGENMVLNSPLPGDFQDVLARLQREMP